MSLLWTESWEKYTAAAQAPAAWNANTTPSDPGLYAVWLSPGTAGAVARTGTKTGYLWGLSRLLQTSEQHATMIAGSGFSNWETGGLTQPQGLFVFRGDNNTVTHVTVVVNTDGSISAYRGTRAGGVLLGTSAAGVISGVATVWTYIEVKVVLSDGAGQVVVQANGANVLNLTGVDTKNGGAAAVLSHVGVGDFERGNGAGSKRVSTDDIYICNGAGASMNTFLGPINIECVAFTGNGAQSQLAGSDGNSVDNYLLVNDAFSTGGTYVQGTTNGQIDTYAHAAASLSTGTILGVVVKANGRLAAGGSRSLGAVGRLGGVNVEGPPASNNQLAAEFGIAPVVTTKPGGGAWTLADINAAEFGYAVRA